MDVFFETAFEVWGETFSWAEVIGAVTGVICVWWVARQVIWNFPIGLANNVFFFVLFVDAKLYADGVLQIAVLRRSACTAGSSGCAARAAAASGDQEPVRRTTATEWAVFAVVWLALLGWWRTCGSTTTPTRRCRSGTASRWR